MKEMEQEKISIVTVFLSIYFALVVFDSVPMFGIGSILKILVLFPVGAILFVKFRSNIEINAMTVLMLTYFIFIAFSYLYSVNRSETFNQIKRIMLNFIVIICAGGMYDFNDAEIKLLKKSLAAGGVLTVVLTFIFADYSAGGRLTLSVNGTVQDQNYLNGYVFFAYIFFLDDVVEKKKPLMAIPAGIILFFTLLTGSRGALLALAIISAMVVICVMLQDKSIRLSTFLIIATGVLLLLLLYKPVLSLLPEGVAERFTLEYIQENGSTGRTEIWAYLLSKFVNSSVLRMLFGYGFGTVAYINEYNHLVAHNLWIEHLLAVGIIGEFLFIAMQVAFIRAAWKTNDIFIISAYAGYLVMMLSLSLLCYKPVWNCMTMILIISRAQNRSLEKRENRENDGIEEVRN